MNGPAVVLVVEAINAAGVAIASIGISVLTVLVALRVLKWMRSAT